MNLPQIPSYEFESLIGEGGTGATYRCRYQGKETRAVKVFNGMAVNHSLLNHALTAVGSSVPHPNLVPVHAFNLQQAPYYYITDYYSSPHGEPATVDQVAGHLPPPVAWRLVEQLVNALSFLHRLDVLHTCVKPGNIFVEYNKHEIQNIRLADFGQGLVPGIHYFEIADTCYFASPEQLRDRDFSHGKGKRWDVYAFGVVAYYILNGKLPRLEERYRDFLRRRNNPRHPTAALQQDDPIDFSLLLFEEPPVSWPKRPRNEYEGQLRDVIDQCLSLSPDDRPADLREVARTFETIRHNADIELLKRQHQAQLRSRSIKVRTLLGTTGIFLLTSLLLLGAALMSFTKVASEADKVVKAEQKRQSDLLRQRNLFDEKVKQEESLRKSAQSETNVRRAEAFKARDFLFESQEQADRFFSAILRAEDVDFPGFQALRRENLEAAAGYFAKFQNTYGKDPDFARQLCRADLFLGEIRRAQGRLPEAITHLTKARDGLQKLEMTPQFRPEFLRESAELERSLHEIESLRGNFAVSDQALARSSALFEELGKTGPGTGAELELAKNRMAAARLLHERGNDAEAETALKKLADQLSPMVTAKPADPQLKADLGECYVRMSALVRRRADTKTALELVRNAGRLFAELIEANGEIESYQYLLAVSLNQEGEITGEIPPLKDAVTLLNRVVGLQPDSPKYRFELANSYGHLAEVLRREGQTEQALPLNNMALGLFKELLTKDPSAPLYRYAYARQNVALAQALLDSSKDSDAVQKFEESIKMLEFLVKEDPDQAEYLLLLAQAQGHAGLARQHLNDKDRALALYQAAKDSWTSLLNRFPNHAEASETVLWLNERLERKL
jgi:serine/threonine protein kinase